MTARGLLCLSVLLAGCVAQPRSDVPVDLVGRRDALMQLDEWSLSGRMGVKYDQRGFTGALNWAQQREQLNANFHGPLGVGAFRISGAPDELILETSDGARYALDDAQDALRSEMGFSIPVDAMRFWLLALPVPSLPAVEELDTQGNLVRLEQRGWEISYERYAPAGTWTMPRKLVMSSSDVTIRLAIRTWRLAPN